MVSNKLTMHLPVPSVTPCLLIINNTNNNINNDINNSINNNIDNIGCIERYLSNVLDLFSLLNRASAVLRSFISFSVNRELNLAHSSAVSDLLTSLIPPAVSDFVLSC